MSSFGIRGKKSLACFLLLTVLLFGCSDDDPTDPGVPEDPRVTTVVINPESATLSAVGTDVQFDADAFDQNGDPIDAEVTWQSSDEDVVVVGQDGEAVATGFGMAEIYATSGSAVDTAAVTVTLGGSPVHAWLAAADGNWNDDANWDSGQVPGTGDVAVINVEGTYTVTLTGDVEVAQLVLGADSGTQTLDTNGNQLQFTDGGVLGGAELVVSGSVVMRGDVVWNGGTITGSGQVSISSGAELHALGNPLELEVPAENRGTIAVGAGASLRVNKLLDSKTGAIVDLQSDAIVTVQGSGNLTSTGTIRKNVGSEEAAIFASSAQFSSSGALRVNKGSLQISGGSLSGTVEIDGDAMLRQTSNTDIPRVNSTGEGPFVVGGAVTIGTFDTEVVTLRHMILDSGNLAAITGPAGLLIDRSFIWRRGTVHQLGSLTTQVGSQTSFESSGTKNLSATTWSITGDVMGDSNVDLTLIDGATVSVANAGRWFQSTGGDVRQGTGSAGSFDVIGEFHKTDDGTFVVGTSLSCSGTLNLAAGTLTVNNGADFRLLDSGVITGGGSEGPALDLRLIVIDAGARVIQGTIRPGLADGTYARMDIQGVVDLESTFRLELDVATDWEFNTESVFFLSAGQEFDGTLALAVLQPVTPGVDYQVVFGNQARGQFIVTGDAQFDECIQNASGVVCRQNN